MNELNRKPLVITIGSIKNECFAVVEAEKDKMREKNRAKFADSKWLKCVSVLGKRHD